MMNSITRPSEILLPRVSAIVLAGGQSRRMGRNKAFLEFKDAPLIAHVIERVQRVSQDVLIVANDADAFAQFGLPVVGDVYPGKGSLGGIFSGLQAAREQNALAVACDMPFLNEALLRYLISLAVEADVIVPRAQDPSSNPARARMRPARDGKGMKQVATMAKEKDLHPLHAVYSKSCLAAMQARLLADDLQMISFYDDVRVRVVEPEEVDRFDPQHRSFFNVNTPEDFKLVESQ